jgi:hypothetical protein
VRVGPETNFAKSKAPMIAAAAASPLALQPPHDLVKLIETAIAHMHYARFATVVDRDFEPERVGDAPLERDRVGVFASAAQLPGRGRRRLAVRLVPTLTLSIVANSDLIDFGEE